MHTIYTHKKPLSTKIYLMTRCKAGWVMATHMHIHTLKHTHKQGKIHRDSGTPQLIFKPNYSHLSRKRDYEKSLLLVWHFLYDFSLISCCLCDVYNSRCLFFCQHKLEMVCLIPELCYMTGLTDEMRADFRVMKVLLLSSLLHG